MSKSIEVYTGSYTYNLVRGVKYRVEKVEGKYYKFTQVTPNANNSYRHMRNNKCPNIPIYVPDSEIGTLENHELITSRSPNNSKPVSSIGSYTYSLVMGVKYRVEKVEGKYYKFTEAPPKTNNPYRHMRNDKCPNIPIYVPDSEIKTLEDHKLITSGLSNDSDIADTDSNNNTPIILRPRNNPNKKSKKVSFPPVHPNITRGGKRRKPTHKQSKNMRRRSRKN